MSEQEIWLMFLSVVFCLIMFSFGGFELAKEAAEALGGIIWEILSWPVKKYRKYKAVKRIEKQWQEYVVLHKGELVTELMKLVQEQYKTELPGKMECPDKTEQAGIAEKQEERTWQDQIMDRFMRKS